MKGILINYEYCTGCHSCEVACRNELGLAKGEFGIKLTEVGPYKYETAIDADTPYEWVYNPTITKACDLCEERTNMGKMPSCVQACQAWCMYYGEVEDLAKRMDGRTRWALYTPIQGDACISTRQTNATHASAAHASAAPTKATEKKATRASVESTYHTTIGEMEVNAVLRGAEKLTDFVAKFATIDEEAAKAQLVDQLLSNEKANKYVLPAADAKDGSGHELGYMGVVMSYDAQGTQLGAGKSYLDKGKKVARKDITVVFM